MKPRSLAGAMAAIMIALTTAGEYPNKWLDEEDETPAGKLRRPRNGCEDRNE